jgi:hypothetical protein
LWDKVKAALVNPVFYEHSGLAVYLYHAPWVARREKIPQIIVKLISLLRKI